MYWFSFDVESPKYASSHIQQDVPYSNVNNVYTYNQTHESRILQIPEEFVHLCTLYIHYARHSLLL